MKRIIKRWITRFKEWRHPSTTADTETKLREKTMEMLETNARMIEEYNRRKYEQ